MKMATHKLAAAAILLAAASTATRADTLAVEYFTTGVFTYSGAGTPTITSNIDGSAAAKIAFGANSAKLAYQSTDVTYGGTVQLFVSDFPNTPPYIANVNLGNFTLSTSGTTIPAGGLDLTGLTFTLTVTQTAPQPGSDSTTGTVTGHVLQGLGSTVLVDFSSTTLVVPLSLPNVVYQITNTGALDENAVYHPNAIAISKSAFNPITATVDYSPVPNVGSAPVPLPSVASMSTTMLGLAGLALLGQKAIRRRHLV